MLNLAKMYTQYFPGLFCLMAVELEDGIVAELGAAGAAFVIQNELQAMGKDLPKHSPAAQARTRNNNDSSNTLLRLVFSTKTGTSLQDQMSNYSTSYCLSI